MNDLNTTPPFEENVRQSFGVPAIRPEFVAQLHADLVQRAAEKTRKPLPFFRLQPAWTVALVILTAMIIGTLVIGPQRVYAEVMKLFGYIPGVGIVDQSSPIRVLAEPVSITRDGITVTVTSAILTGDKTHIDYRTFGVPGSAYPDREDVMGCIQQPYLRLPDGTQLSQMNNDFLPVPANTNEAVFVLPCIVETLPGKVPENWELPLRFVPAPPDLTIVPVIESLPSQIPTVVANTPTLTGVPVIESLLSQTPSVVANTPTPEINPLAITKVLDIGGKFVVMGEFSYSAAGDASLPAGSWWAIQRVSIIGADGREVPQTYSNDLEPPTPTRPDSEPWLYQLDKNFVPPVTITYAGEIISPVGSKEQAEFEFDAGLNPQNGSVWTVNKDFSLGGYNIRLVSIESSSGGYSFHFKADSGASANAISVDIVGYTPNCGGGGGGDQFPEEFDRTVCYASFSGSPEFPHGALKAVLNFQALKRQNKSFQVQWSPDLAAGPFVTSTPQPDVCLRSDTLAQLQPVPPALSNGKALFYEGPDANGKWGLVLYNLDGSQKQVLTTDGNWGALSPDGSRVAYSGSDNKIHLIDVASLAEKVLPGADGFDLHWSPDGKQIAYVGMGNGIVDSVFIVNVDGAQVRQVSNLSYETILGWSPDSTQLYFVVPFTGGAAWKVFSFDLASSAVQERFTIENGTPKFLNAKLSPDGNWIAYRGRDNSSLYLVHTDGSGMRLLVDNAGAVGVEWGGSGWLGVSLEQQGSGESTVVLMKPDGCEPYLLPALHGELEGLSIP